jgi:hypothetical protein
MCFCFHAYGQIYQKIKKIILYFHTKKKLQKMFSMYFGFNNQFIKARRTKLIF